MDKQEVFNKVANHLLTQNAKSLSAPDSKVCSYRSHDGLKCAIGALIKDEFYDSSMERFGVDQPSILQAVESSLGVALNRSDVSFLIDFQLIHDWSEVSDWPEKLKELAERYSLEMVK